MKAGITEAKDTEKFAIEEAVREAQWQKDYGEKLPDLVSKMNELLKEGSEESRSRLYDMCQEGGVFDSYKQNDVMAQMYVITSIYKMEKEAGITNGILERGDTVEELMKYMQKVKFLMYRLDFEVCKEEEWLRLFKECQVSTVTLEILMKTTVMRPVRIALRMEKLFEEAGMYAELFCIYRVLFEKYPGNCHVLNKMAELYLRIGKREEARALLMQIPSYPKEICGDKGQVFEIQELLWLLRYKQWDMCPQLIKLLKKRQMSREGWLYMLQIEGVTNLEYYLRLVEEMLDNGLQELAQITLELGKEKCADE